MTVFLNGKFVLENEARVSVFDRSFQYGDGLFETVRISNGEPFRWMQHLDRLERGARFLQIQTPFTQKALGGFLAELVRLNDSPEAVLRIALSRGVGQRGYSARGTREPTVVMSLHPTDPMSPSPKQWKLFTSSLRLDENTPLAHLKTSNKLVQIMARMEAEQNGCDEALLLNSRGEPWETSSGNLFWIDGNTLRTPPVEAGLLPGVTRAIIMELATKFGLNVVECRVPPAAFSDANGAFVTLSSLGLIEIISLDGNPLQTTRHTRSLYQAYRRLLTDETRRKA